MDNYEEDLSKDLRNAMAEHGMADEKTPEVVAETVMVEEPKGEEGQPRGEDGKFAAKPEAEPEKPTEAAPAEEPASPVEDRVPDAWGNRKEIWAALTPEAKQAISQRESDVQKQFSRNDEERSLGKSMRDTILPYMPMIQAEGGDAVKAVESLLNTAYVLRQAPQEQKVALLRELAGTYNIPLDQVSSPAAFEDPAIAALQREIAELKTGRQTDTQAQQAQARATVDAQVQAFAADPAHPHYETVKPVMAALLTSGAANDLPEAYEKACYADPSIRSSLEQTRRAADAAKATEAAAAAKRAAGSVTGAPGAVQTAAVDPNRSLEQELWANYQASTGRV